MTAPQIQMINIGGAPHISMADAARTSGFSREYITRLARSGKLPARRLSRNWFIALAALRTLAPGTSTP